MKTTETNMRLIPCDFANPTHRQALATLINVYIADDMGGGTPLSEAEQQALVEGLSCHPKAIVLLAECEGVYAGLLTAFENFSTFTARPMINIHDVIVCSEYRGRGVGRLLLDGLIREAALRKASRLSLEVRRDNLVAQGLYKDLGFGETSPGMYYWRRYME
jgi:GNAT superfamily N-acetyltransferase